MDVIDSEVQSPTRLVCIAITHAKSANSHRVPARVPAGKRPHHGTSNALKPE